MSDLIELKEKALVTREQAAERLRDIADQLSRHNNLEFERGGMHIKAKVADEVQLKIEFEIDDDKTEMEIELTW